MDAPFIEFRDVKKAFGERSIYDGLSLSVRRGETLTIVGGSGSGKSVLLKMLIGLLKPDSGAILFDGVDVARASEEELLPVRRRISMLFQGGALFDSMSVSGNIAYPLRVQGLLGEDAIAARVGEVLSEVGLSGSEALSPDELSGGMKKRVALARAIASKPEVVLYDEPTTGLDPITTRRIVELISAIHERAKTTAIVVTHDLASAFFVSSRVAMLSERRTSMVLPVEEFRRSSDPAIREFISAMPMAEVAP